MFHSGKLIENHETSSLLQNNQQISCFPHWVVCAKIQITNIARSEENRFWNVWILYSMVQFLENRAADKL